MQGDLPSGTASKISAIAGLDGSPATTSLGTSSIVSALISIRLLRSDGEDFRIAREARRVAVSYLPRLIARYVRVIRYGINTRSMQNPATCRGHAPFRRVARSRGVVNSGIKHQLNFKTNPQIGIEARHIGDDLRVFICHTIFWSPAS